MKPMLAISVILALSISACGGGGDDNGATVAPIMEAASVASLPGRSSDEVTELLGAGECEPSKYGPKCTYQGGSIEIVFTERGADWITINDMEGPFAPGVVGIAGAPSFANDNVIRWEPARLGAQEILSVSLFADGNGKVDYLYIKSFTK